MSTARAFTRNIASNWVGFAVQILVAFLLTPFVVRTLGNDYYGIWTLIVGLTGYYGLLDLGFSASLNQYITRYLAEGKLDKLNETASTGFAILCVCAGGLVAASIALAATAPLVFELPPETVPEVRIAVLVVGIGMAAQFLFFPFSAVFPATQRFDLANAIGVGTRFVFAVSTYTLLTNGYGLIGLSIATTSTNILDYVLRFFVARRLLPTLKVSPRRAKLSRGWELAQFGIWNLIIAGSTRLISYTDAIVIGLFLPPAAITPFALAANLNDYFLRVFVPIGQVFYPAFTALDAKGDDRGIRKLFLDGSRLLATLAMPSALIAFVLASDFFELWIGDAARNPDYPAAGILFQTLIVAGLFNAMQRVSYQVLMATRRLKQMALLFQGQAIANIVLSVLLIHSIGLRGVALGTIIPSLVVEGVILPVTICRWYGVGAVEYLRQTYGRALLVTVALSPVLIAVVLVQFQLTWTSFFARAVLLGAFALIWILVLGLEREERERFVWQPAARLKERLASTKV